MVVDLFFILILSLFTIRGAYRGFVREVFSLVAILIGFVVAYRYHYLVEGHLLEVLEPYPSHVLAPVILFVATFMAFHLLLLLISLIIDSTGLSFFNRLLGGGVGFLKGILISSLLVFGVERFKAGSYSLFKESILFSRISDILEYVKTLPGGVF